MAAFLGSGPISSRICAAASPEPAQRRQVWGRNRGPGLKPSQEAALARLGARVLFDPPSANFAPSALFDRRAFPGDAPRAYALEIGFGGGEHLLHQARSRADWAFIGVEPFLNGVAKCVLGMERDGLDNIRLMRDDARLLLAQLPDACLDRIWILYPDPWPKARHKKRRIVNPETLARAGRALRPGGRLRLATDIVDYGHQMLRQGLAEPTLAWTARRAADWRDPPDDWLRTRYEEKALREGRTPLYLEFERR